jgi:uncharacterized Tic20 family protein
VETLTFSWSLVAAVVDNLAVAVVLEVFITHLLLLRLLLTLLELALAVLALQQMQARESERYRLQELTLRLQA